MLFESDGKSHFILNQSFRMLKASYLNFKYLLWKWSCPMWKANELKNEYERNDIEKYFPSIKHLLFLKPQNQCYISVD